MALDLANPATTTLSPVATAPVAALTAITVTATANPGAAAANAPIAGDGTTDNSQHATTSSTVMIIIGCVIGILGVVGVITLIWWMRKRALAQQTYMPTDLPAYTSKPKPPPKAPILATQKSLPEINDPAMTRTARSGTVGSADKDKALPIKPPESVWSPTGGPKSPALASVAEVTAANRGRNEREAREARERSTSVGSYKAPQNFI